MEIAANREQSIGWELITSAVAEKMLEKVHGDQRRVRESRVSAYAEDMAAGRWRSDAADTIMIDWDGYLIDGQHRLSAVVESGKPTQFLVARNCDPAIMAYKDQGAARTVVDSLRVAGLTEAMGNTELATAASIARSIIQWELGRYTAGARKGTNPPTHAQVGQRFIDQRDIIPATKIGLEAYRDQKPPLVAATVYGFFFLLVSRIDSVRAMDWHQAWLSADQEPPGSAISAVREKFYVARIAALESSYSNKVKKLNPDEQLALLIKAWNRWMGQRNTTVRQLQLIRGKLTNANFPKPMNTAQARVQDEY